ncbi:VRR-NUC domain-containing protein [uncultured Megasphaera sp.]|uniref:VRR-NUC domain-containing protein n=1 Tax=uncultured Megasphaera sp. TaxID=165188 RepID=UPI0025CE06DE|nr:VRR-NUC domain-containing protein [uncultured Megasphaera sp.]
MELERNIERKLVQGVKAMGGIAYKWVSPGNTGVPDRIVIFPDGRIEFVELKTETNKPTPLQLAQMRKLMSRNCTVYVLSGMQAVNEYLDSHALRLGAGRGREIDI